MKTAHVNDRADPHKDFAPMTKAQKIQELSDILDEIFSLKAKIKNKEGANDEK